MTASFDGHVEIVRLLIEAKAQLNIQEKKVFYHIVAHCECMQR